MSERQMIIHNTIQWDGLAHPTYNTYEARLRSYIGWPSTLKQKPEKLSEAGFFYAGKPLWELKPRLT
jgi:hypothetical protein